LARRILFSISLALIVIVLDGMETEGRMWAGAAARFDSWGRRFMYHGAGAFSVRAERSDGRFTSYQVIFAAGLLLLFVFLPL
jgi:hypothetical protein